MNIWSKLRSATLVYNPLALCGTPLLRYRSEAKNEEWAASLKSSVTVRSRSLKMLAHF